jgi:hypothetical protein
MIITAEEESSKVVTTKPVTIAEKVFEVKRNIHFLEFSPNASCIVSERLFTANKNKTKPPIIASIISIIVTILSNRKNVSGPIEVNPEDGCQIQLKVRA